MNSEIYIFLIVLVVSSSISWGICLMSHQIIQLASGRIDGPQRIHDGQVPRIGGLAILLTTVTTVVVSGKEEIALLAVLTIAALPVVLAGLVEDFTGSVSAVVRLFMSLVSGSLFCFLTGYQLTDAYFNVLNDFLHVPLVGFLVTSLAIASMVNAINIIDGLNGLSAGTTILMLMSIGILASLLGDIEVAFVSLLIVPAILGFLIFNFPFGKIFLGDGGAYFLGFLLAGLAILLNERNSEVSPFAIFLIVAYPLYELVRSVCRRVLTPGYFAFEPDKRHLHHLLYEFVARRTSMSRVSQNNCSSLAAMLFPAICCAWALVFFRETVWLMSGFCLFVILYEVTSASVSTKMSLE